MDPIERAEKDFFKIIEDEKNKRGKKKVNFTFVLIKSQFYLFE